MNGNWTYVALGCALLMCGGGAAETSWFDGAVGGVAVGGAWTAPLPEGVSLTGGCYVLGASGEPLAFAAFEAKVPGVYTNLIFRTTMRFGEAYEDGYPEVPAGRKFPITVCRFGNGAATYCVQAKDPASDPATNRWVDTGIAASVDADVSLTVTIRRDVGGTTVRYAFGDAAYEAASVTDGAVGTAVYAGECQVATLTGACQENWIPPQGREIPPEAQNSVEAWAKRHNVPVDRFSDETVDSQGRTRYEACLLDLAPDEALVVTADVSRAGTALGVGVRPPLAGVGEKVVYTLSENGVQKECNSTGSFDVSLGKGRTIYSVQASVDGVAAGNPSKKVGAQSASVVAAGTYLPVPWTDHLMADMKVTELIKTSELRANDQIDVYDAVSEKWITCVYDGSAWAVAVPTDRLTPSDGNIPTLSRGQAFRFTPQGSGAGTLYLIGGADAPDVVSTPVVPNAMNLVAKPDGTAFALSKLGKEDKVKVFDAKAGLPSITYLYYHGWYRKNVSDETYETATEIPAGQGFFLQPTSSEVNW